MVKPGAPGTDRVLSYKEFAGRIRQAANLLRRLGVGDSDAVAILALADRARRRVRAALTGMPIALTIECATR